MLQKLRDKTTGWIAIVVVGILVVPFALFGLNKYFVQGSSSAVATIQAPPTWWSSAPSWWPASLLWQQQQVDVNEFTTRFRQQRRRQRLQQGDAFDARAYQSVDNKRAVLDTLIDEKVRAMAARNAGIVVSDAMVRSAIQQMPAFQVDGEFNLERYQLALASRVPRRSPREYDRLVRKGLQETLVASAVVDSNFVTDHEIQRLAQLMFERRDVSLVLMPAPKADASKAVSDAQAQAWYAGHKAAYHAPQTVSIEYLELDAAAMPAPPAATETQLRALYEEQGGRFARQEQRLASHILVRVADDADEAARQQAREQARQLAEKARADGVDFAALARASSDDAGSSSSGGDLGWIGKDVMPAPFEEALFALQPGDVSDPIQTDFGWHVIKLRDVKAGEQAPFEQVRDTLAREQAEADRARQFNQAMGELIDEVYKNPSSLASASRELGLPVLEAGPFTQDASEGIASNAAVRKVAFSDEMIADRMTSDAIEIGPDHSVVIRVTGHTPERAQPLEQVRDQVVAAVRADRARQAALARADALLARVRGGEDLAAVAEAEGLPAPQLIPGVPRNVPVPEVVVSEAIFAAPVPTPDEPSAGKAELSDGRIALFTVDKVTPGDLSMIPAPRREQLRKRIAQVGGNNAARDVLSAQRKRMQVSVMEDKL